MTRNAIPRLVAVAAAVAALATACGSGGGPSAAPTTTPTTPSQAEPVTGPSQSAADARRDGVIEELAALPLSVRMDVQAEAVAPEGVWVLSRPAAEAAKQADGCRLGPETGEYPKDTICTTEYGEVLLLSADRATVLRAYPLAAVPATFLRVVDGAVYFGRAGDETLDEYALPDTMVGRIDRTTFAALIRVYAPGAESEVLQPCYVLPGNWRVTKARLAMTDLRVDADGVWAGQPNGRWTRLDPVTLKVTAKGVIR